MSKKNFFNLKKHTVWDSKICPCFSALLGEIIVADDNNSQVVKVIICPRAIVYSAEQVINSVSVCRCVCPSVCLSVRTIAVAFLD